MVITKRQESHRFARHPDSQRRISTSIEKVGKTLEKRILGELDGLLQQRLGDFPRSLLLQVDGRLGKMVVRLDEVLQRLETVVERISAAKARLARRHRVDEELRQR